MGRIGFQWTEVPAMRRLEAFTLCDCETLRSPAPEFAQLFIPWPNNNPRQQQTAQLTLIELCCESAILLWPSELNASCRVECLSQTTFLINWI